MKYLKNKKTVIALLSLLLVLCITAASTAAYLNSITGEQRNVFTPSRNISARLQEPNWNEAEGLKLVPGKMVRKDPMIVNTCNIDEYVAIRLTFQDESGSQMSETDLKKLLDLLVIDWNSDWVLTSGTISTNPPVQPFVFYCKTILEPGKTTQPLFSSITVKDESDGLTEAQLRWLQGVKITNGNIVNDPDGIGKFQIKVEGAAVQAVGFENAAGAADTLKALFP